jgi:hypothetical protein
MLGGTEPQSARRSRYIQFIERSLSFHRRERHQQRHIVNNGITPTLFHFTNAVKSPSLLPLEILGQSVLSTRGRESLNAASRAGVLSVMKWWNRASSDRRGVEMTTRRFIRLLACAQSARRVFRRSIPMLGEERKYSSDQLPKSMK